VTGAEHSHTADELPDELTVAIAETARILFSAGSVFDTLQAVVRLAVETIEGCDVAGIFILEGGTVTTPVQTDPIVAEVDAAQHRCGEGPCLDAIGQGGSFYADELADNLRWPSFGPEATAIGIRSALAANLHTTDLLGSLNMYGRYPRAFGVVDRANAVLLASFAGLALTSAEAHAADARRFDNLEVALDSREIIGQAQGILIERERITASEAFDILRRGSQHLNRKLKEVAQDLIDTGERPQTGKERPPA
jgi:hypothetical protein